LNFSPSGERRLEFSGGALVSRAGFGVSPKRTLSRLHSLAAQASSRLNYLVLFFG
jgi:hypothetical protein